MKVALYYRHIEQADLSTLDALDASLRQHGIETCPMSPESDLAACDCLLSIGGDGTLLSCVQLARSAGQRTLPPILGVNFGHLGFLTTVGKDSVNQLAADLIAHRYTLEERTLLSLTQQSAGQPADERFALNEVFLHRREEASLLRIEVSVDGQYVATYAGDGVIVATPTGSTAYSLSCGGPILTPDSRGFLITPISAHTLTLRPIIVPDTSAIALHVCDDCFLGIDSARTTLAGGTRLLLRRAGFTISLVRMGEQNFFSAIRDKLMWGTEIRP